MTATSRMVPVWQATARSCPRSVRVGTNADLSAPASWRLTDHRQRRPCLRRQRCPSSRWRPSRLTGRLPVLKLINVEVAP
jgi:hypothetical protein